MDDSEPRKLLASFGERLLYFKSLHSGNVAEQGETPHLDSSRKMTWLPVCPNKNN